MEDIVIEGSNDIVIEGVDDDVTINGVIEAAENGEAIDIEAIEWSFGSIFKKVRKIAGVANSFGLLPPGTGFGLKVLDSLTRSHKTRNRVKFKPKAVGNIYRAAWAKGYKAGLKQAARQANNAARKIRG